MSKFILTITVLDKDDNVLASAETDDNHKYVNAKVICTGVIAKVRYQFQDNEVTHNDPSFKGTLVKKGDNAIVIPDSKEKRYVGFNLTV